MKAASFSIVVPCFDAGASLGRTLESLAIQDLEGLEVIVQDAGSGDRSVEEAAAYVARDARRFRRYVDRDTGPAAALNLGFSRATGTRMGFLRAGDVLLPGALARVAAELDPARGRLAVMGRCAFLHEDGTLAAAEYPAEYRGHAEFLAPWRHGLAAFPQASVFWHRLAWERCGPFDEALRHGYAYDFACRISAQFGLPKIEVLCAAMVAGSTSARTPVAEADLLEMHVAISRRHWGSWLSAMRWRCEAAHFAHRHQWHEHACHHARRAEAAMREGRRLAVLAELAMTAAYSPAMARRRLLPPLLRTAPRA